MPARDSLVAVVAENVRVACARLGWNQSDLARALGVSTSTVNTKWRGARAWQLEDLQQMTKVLNVSVQDLVREYTARDSNPEPAGLLSRLVRWLLGRGAIGDRETVQDGLAEVVELASRRAS